MSPKAKVSSSETSDPLNVHLKGIRMSIESHFKRNRDEFADPLPRPQWINYPPRLYYSPYGSLGACVVLCDAGFGQNLLWNAWNR